MEQQNTKALTTYLKIGKHLKNEKVNLSNLTSKFKFFSEDIFAIHVPKILISIFSVCFHDSAFTFKSAIEVSFENTKDMLENLKMILLQTNQIILKTLSWGEWLSRLKHYKSIGKFLVQTPLGALPGLGNQPRYDAPLPSAQNLNKCSD